MPDDDIRRLRDDLHRELNFLKEQLDALATDFNVLIACNPALLEQVIERAAGSGAGPHGVHRCQLFVNKYASQCATANPILTNDNERQQTTTHVGRQK